MAKGDAKPAGLGGSAESPSDAPASESGEPDAADMASLAAPPSLERPDRLEADRVRAAIRRRLFDVTAVAPKVGRYELRQRIGAGAMGAVFLARDEELKRDVALKVIRPRTSGEQAEVVRRRLLREARAMARLRHPNVITVYEAGIADGSAFIAMEYVEGETLRGWLERVSPSWQEALSVLRQAGRGLAAAHAAGLVHRDFKPDNVLIGSDRRVQVTDFGVVQALAVEGDGGPPSQPPAGAPASATLTRTANTEWARAGTPRYMAPEQHAGLDIDPRADQFAFCVTSYEAVFGHGPFAGDTLDDLARAIQQGSIREPADPRRAPSWLLPVLRRGLSPDPEDRHPSMDALLDQLRAAPQRAPRWRLAALGATVLVVAAFVYVLRTAEEGPRASAPSAVPRPSHPSEKADPEAVQSAVGTDPTATSTVQSPQALPGFATTTVGEGKAPDGTTWVPSFSIVRHEGDENASFLQAQDGCRARSMALCTESQWARACALHGALGAVETWTSTAVTDRGIVVRGGRQSCTARRIVSAAERHDARVGTCCNRGVSIVTDRPSVAFVRTTSARLLKVEMAISRGNGSLLGSLVDDRLTYLARSLPRDDFLALAERAYREYPDQWLIHDACDVDVVEQEGASEWTADCRSLVHQRGKLAHLIRRYVFGGPHGRLRAIGEPTVYRGFRAP